MPRIARVFLVLLTILAVVRATAFLVYAGFRLSLPGEVWYLEPKMVHLAWRFQEGVRLYPPWRDYPHVANFFGPGYSGLVGLIGRLVNADLDGLTRIGRAVTLACGLLTSLILGLATARERGVRIGFLVAALSLGSGAMIGFGLMVRADTMAGLLGVIGLLIVVEGRGRSWIFAVLPFVLACFTKQTAATYVVASVCALVSQRRWSDAIGMILTIASILAGITLGITRWGDPMFAASLLGESQTPWRWISWIEVVGKLLFHSPDLLVIPLAGFIFWIEDRPAMRGRMAASLVLLVLNMVAIGKHGADLNYFLDLRIVQAWAIACFLACDWPRLSPHRSRIKAGAILVSALSLVPSSVWMLEEARDAVKLAIFYQSEKGRTFVSARGEIEALVADRSLRVLTDSSYLQARMKDRAEFGDPWLFRVQVDAGLIRPSRMELDLERGCYDWIITMRDLFAPRDPSDENSLPRPLLYRARERYRFVEEKAGLYHYSRSRPADASCSGQ